MKMGKFSALVMSTMAMLLIISGELSFSVSEAYTLPCPPGFTLLTCGSTAEVYHNTGTSGNAVVDLTVWNGCNGNASTQIQGGGILDDVPPRAQVSFVDTVPAGATLVLQATGSPIPPYPGVCWQQNDRSCQLGRAAATPQGSQPSETLTSTWATSAKVLICPQTPTGPEAGWYTDGITLLDGTTDPEKVRNVLALQMREAFLAAVNQAEEECKKKGGTFVMLPIPQTTTHQCSDMTTTSMTYTIRVSIKFTCQCN